MKKYEKDINPKRRNRKLIPWHNIIFDLHEAGLGYRAICTLLAKLGCQTTWESIRNRLHAYPSSPRATDLGIGHLQKKLSLNKARIISEAIARCKLDSSLSKRLSSKVKTKQRVVVHLVISTKGGAGTTTYASQLYRKLISHGKDLKILDYDSETASLNRCVPSAEIFDSRNQEHRDQLIHVAENLLPQGGMVLAHLPTGSTPEWLEWLMEVPFDDLKEKGIQFVIHATVTAHMDSMTIFLRWREKLSYSPCDFVLVENQYQGTWRIPLNFLDSRTKRLKMPKIRGIA